MVFTCSVANTSIPVLYIASDDGFALRRHLLTRRSNSNNNSSSSDTTHGSNSSLTNMNMNEVTVFITGSGPLIDEEKQYFFELHKHRNFTYNKDATAYGVNSLGWNDERTHVDNYDPCIDDHPLQGIYCENGHVVLITASLVGLSFLPSPMPFTQLRSIIVFGNELSGSAAWLCHSSLTQLTSADVSHNSLTSICGDDSNSQSASLFSLTAFNAGFNRLSVFPMWLLSFSSTLQILSINDNQIFSFPSLLPFVHLQHLDLSNNDAYFTISSFQSFSDVVVLLINDK